MHYLVIVTDIETPSITISIHANSREEAIAKARAAALEFADRTPDAMIEVVEADLC